MLQWQSDRRQAATLCPKVTPTPSARHVDDPVLPVEFLPQDYIRDVLLGDDHMERREIKLYGRSIRQQHIKARKPDRIANEGMN